MTDLEYRLPTVDEVLGGETQGGVARPGVLDTEWAAKPSSWAARPNNPTRWQAVKQLLRIIFGRKAVR
jgi:hypothetical protein